MKKYVISSDDRPPLRFTGELIGNYPEDKLDFDDPSSLLEYARENYHRYTSSQSFLHVEMYRTQNNKIVILERRFHYCSSEDPANEDINVVLDTLTTKLTDYLNFEHYKKDSIKEKGVYGRVTMGLMSVVCRLHPEFEDLWVDDID